MNGSRRLNIGCGTDIMAGYVNLDNADLPGVDVVHSLEEFPYPFADGSFDEIVAINVLEHLEDTVKVMEELWRIAAPGARVTIRVPYWNSMDSITDPTHKKLFNQHSFEFFDPDNVRCRKRPYYSTARFRIARVTYFVKVLRYFPVRNPLAKAVIGLAARHLNSVIWVIEFDLVAVR